jgi:serine/threonine protein kinase
MVMLLGACPENGCIVYEYMANGSLADRLACKGGTPPLPWYVRLRICAEVATALLFLHSRPEPIVHRDLKPGNILLDQNLVSKVGDMGIAKLVPSNMTLKATLVKGTPGYMDPDYEQNGSLSCESDVYALGIVMLQMLSGLPAAEVIECVRDAIVSTTAFAKVLDESAGDWPLEEAMELARLALQCIELPRRERLDLQTVILPALEKLRVSADTKVVLAIASSQAVRPVIPSHLFDLIPQLLFFSFLLCLHFFSDSYFLGLRNDPDVNTCTLC